MQPWTSDNRREGLTSLAGFFLGRLRRWQVSTLVTALAFDPVEARPGDRAFAAAFGACGQSCVIKFNPGGEQRVFIAAARAVRAGAKRVVVIDGPCISACALFADVAREKVCVTSRAIVGSRAAAR